MRRLRFSSSFNSFWGKGKGERFVDYMLRFWWGEKGERFVDYMSSLCG